MKQLCLNIVVDCTDSFFSPNAIAVFNCQQLPQVQTLALGDKHLVAGLHTEGFIPSIDVGQSTIDTPFTEGMRIALCT